MKYICCVMLLSVAAVFQTSFAAVSTPQFEKDFKDLILKSKLAIVHFINYDLLPVGEENKTEAHVLTEQLDDLKEDFTDVSHNDDLDEVLFVGVDLRAVPDLADDYDIKDLSTIILFKDGKPFKRRGEVVKRIGIMSHENLEDWIEEYFEDFITKLKVYARNKKPAPRTTRYTYEPYKLRYYYRPFSSPSWYRSYWRRPYYKKYRSRPYYWRHGGYGYGPGSGFGIGIGGHRGGIGYGFGW